MFKSIVRTVGLTCLAAIAGLATEAQGAATVSLKAVAKNGTPITPTNSLAIAPNDTITVEMFFSGWGTPPFDNSSGLVKTYQGTLLGEAGAISNGGDINNNAQLVLPVGWNAPVVKQTCPCDANGPYPNCDPAYGCVKASACVGGVNAGQPCIANSQCPGSTCNAANHFPANMASLNTGRLDFIFRDFVPNVVTGVDVASLNARWGAVITDIDGQLASRCQGGTNSGQVCGTDGQCPGSTCNANYQNYSGTLNLKAGSSACGTYTFTLSPNASSTFIANTDPNPVTVLPVIQGLTLTTGISCPTPNGACCIEATGVCTNNVPQGSCTGRFGGPGSTCATLSPPCVATPVTNTITGVTPAHCLIDARRPFPPNQAAQRQGFTSMTLAFANPLTTGEDAPADFQVTQIPAAPAPPNPPTITTVVPGAGNTLTLNFSVPIQPNRWTCVRHIASNSRRCIGFLPADTNSNRTAAPADILDIIDNLNGIRNPPLQIHQCDIDRSNVCAAQDIIAEIDLLNGVNGYTVQNGRTLEVCPSTTP